jgi:serine/threonine protein kinase
MKSIKKSLLDTERKKLSVQVEKEILEKIDHPLLIKKHFYFDTPKYHHFVLDFCPGGELYFHMKQTGKFKEQVARAVVV